MADPELRFFPDPQPVPFDPDPSAELPATAEVIVVGAGMVGASAAYRLAQAGMRPLVVEANVPAFGASGRNAGLALAGLGGHFPRATRLVQEAGGRSILDYTQASLRLLQELEDALPCGSECKRAGSLDLFLDEAQERHGVAMAELQAAEGLEVRIVGRDELRELAPALDVERVRSAKWTPGDLKLNPFALCYRLLESAAAAGATIVTGVRVEELQVRGGRVAGVVTSHGEVAAGAVLLATNAWTPAVAPALAANLTPIREHVCVTEQLPPLLGPGFETNQCNEYWRQMRTGEILIGGYAVADEGQGIGAYDLAVRPAVPPLLAALLGRLHPAARDARIVRCWTGLLDFATLEIPMAGALVTDDGTAVPGGHLVAGLTGHGHPYAPILGLLMAERIAEGQERTLSLAPFDPRRYAGLSHEPTWLAPFQGHAASGAPDPAAPAG